MEIANMAKADNKETETVRLLKQVLVEWKRRC